MLFRVRTQEKGLNLSTCLLTKEKKSNIIIGVICSFLPFFPSAKLLKDLPEEHLVLNAFTF